MKFTNIRFYSIKECLPACGSDVILRYEFFYEGEESFFPNTKIIEWSDPNLSSSFCFSCFDGGDFCPLVSHLNPQFDFERITWRPTHWAYANL